MSVEAKSSSVLPVPDASGGRQSWPRRLERLLAHLACPHCHGELIEEAQQFVCAACSKAYPIRNRQIHFITPFHAEDALDVIKNRLKKYLGTAYYTVGVTVLAPSYPFNYRRAIRAHVDPAAALVVDLGCGNHRIDDDIVTLDATDYQAVDIVADLGALPFKDGAIDALCSRSVLEHVPDLPTAAVEIGRCTRRGGLGIHFIPFMFPFHASPHDYTRLTHAGAARLFGPWLLVEQRGTAGPVTLFSICFIECMATLFSFGRQKLKAPIYFLFCLLVFPLKIFDAPFVGRKSFLGLAPTILTVLRKP